MTTGIRSDASGTFGALTFGGDDAVTFDATGIQAGSYKPGSIVAADLANGALIENAPVGIGYGIGAGGTVIQATSKATAVTLNKPTGKITMHNASLPASSGVIFVLNNSLLTTADTLSIGVSGGSSSPDDYSVRWRMNMGAAAIVVVNTAGSARAEAVELTFNAHKGATS